MAEFLIISAAFAHLCVHWLIENKPTPIPRDLPIERHVEQGADTTAIWYVQWGSSAVRSFPVRRLDEFDGARS